MITKKIYKGCNLKKTLVTTLVYSEVKKYTSPEELILDIPANALQDMLGTYILDVFGEYIALQPLD